LFQEEAKVNKDSDEELGGEILSKNFKFFNINLAQ